MKSKRAGAKAERKRSLSGGGVFRVQPPGPNTYQDGVGAPKTRNVSTLFVPTFGLHFIRRHVFRAPKRLPKIDPDFRQEMDRDSAPKRAGSDHQTDHAMGARRVDIPVGLLVLMLATFIMTLMLREKAAHDFKFVYDCLLCC